MALVFSIVSGAHGLSDSHGSTGKESNFEFMQRMRAQAQKESLRQTETYKRIFPVCNGQAHIKQLTYVYAASEQVLKLSSGDTQEYERFSQQTHKLSALLEKDLNQVGFYLALNDCGYSSEATSRFIASLILLDASGKLLGVVGVITAYKFSLKLMKAVLSYSKLAAGTLTLGSFSYAVYQVYHELKKQKELAANEQELDVSQLDQVFDSEKIKKESQNMRALTLNLLQRDLEACQAQPAKDCTKIESKIQRLAETTN